MGKWICKVSRSGETMRVTLPRALVQEAGWKYVSFFELELREDGAVVIWGFGIGEGIEAEGESDPAGVD